MGIIGDYFQSFLSTEKGCGLVGMEKGNPFIREYLAKYLLLLFGVGKLFRAEGTCLIPYSNTEIIVQLRRG
jgi:hypothetical protein